MSFSYEIKNKLASFKPECEFCKTAELYGIMRFASLIKSDRISIITEHKAVSRRINELMADCVGYTPEEKEYFAGCRFEISGETKLDILEQKLHLNDNSEDFSEEIMPFACCRQSYIRGAFIGGGSISDPQKSYHLEFDTHSEKNADELLAILAKEGIASKKTQRKSHFIVYIKGYETIAGLLGLIGAGLASMEIYNISIEKEIRNAVNRRLNCESANMDKVVKAYGKHFVAIEKIKNTIGIDALPDTLKEIANVRINFPDESLKELGTRLENPIGKSGVNHRLNRIMEIADNLPN